MKKFVFILVIFMFVIASVSYADYKTNSNTTLNTGSKNNTTSVLNTNINALSRITGTEKNTGSYNKITGTSKTTGTSRTTGTIGLATNAKYREKVQDLMKNMDADLKDMKVRQDQVKINKTEDVVCTNIAISKREAVLDIAFDSYASAMKDSLQERNTALQNAYDQTDKKNRVKDINNIQKMFKTNSDDAHFALKDARKAAYTAFKVDAKACGTTSIDSEPVVGFDKVSI